MLRLPACNILGGAHAGARTIRMSWFISWSLERRARLSAAFLTMATPATTACKPALRLCGSPISSLS